MNANTLLGLDTETLEWYQMSLRALLVFLLAIAFIRIAGVRTLGKQTPFDQLTTLMMGAILGRTIVVAQGFINSLIAALALMIMHRIIAWITFKNKTAGYIFKGDKLLLMKDGILHYENLQKAHITENDILESLRKDIHTASLSDISEIYLERSGKISFIKNKMDNLK